MSGGATADAKPPLYAVPVGEQWLVWAPFAWTAAVVNRAAAARLARRLAGDGAALAGGLQELWASLTRVPRAAAGPEEQAGKIVIIPTRACNMRCVYCDFGAGLAPGTTLDPRLACRLVDHAAAQLAARGERTLRVHVFGGEPLVAPACTEAVVHYTRAVCARLDLVPWFEITTNGFFDPALIPFVGDYIDSAVVSLDGPADLHDHNRRRRDGGGTYEKVAANVRALAGYPVELCLRTCVTNRSEGSVEELASRLCDEFRPDVLSFEMLAENSCGAEAGLCAPDPVAFAGGILKAEAVAARRGVRVVHGPSELKGPRESSCPLGQGTLMLTPEGALAACYLNPDRWTARGLDLTLGRVEASAGVGLDPARVAAVEALVRAKPRCARCFCRHTCAGGCRVDQTPPGCSPDYDGRCKAIRAITAGRLLRRLGLEEEALRLAASPSAMQAAACSPDDRLASWGAP